MNIRFFLGLAFITGLLFSGCTKDNNNDIEKDGGLKDGATIKLMLSNPSSTRANTYGEVGDDAKNENTIDNVEIWVFKANGVLSIYKNFIGPQANYKFVVPNAEANMKFLVSTNQTVGTAATYEAAVNKIASAPVFTPTIVGDDGNTRTVPNRLVMTGWTKVTITPPAPNTSPVTPVTINIMRLVSKVEAPKEIAGGAVNNIPEGDLKTLFGRDDLLQADVSFAMTGFVFINGLNKTSIFNYWNAAGIESDPWSDQWRVGKTYHASIFKTAPPTEAGHYNEVYSGSKDGAGLFLNIIPNTASDDVVYVYENSPVKDAVDPDIYFDKSTVYSFILKGTLTDEAATSGAVSMTRYWRANLIPLNDYKVTRNTIYRVVITGVNSIGYDTPKDAEEEVVPQKGNASVQISINVAKWNIKLQGTIL